MGRTPCCKKLGLKKGPWTPEEDQKLLSYIEEHGHGNWKALASIAGLQRCGKSCRLRWTNYLRPDIKRGEFSLQEEQTIIQLHAFLGNRWSAIATHLPKRTDNEIKNYWNTHLKKRLAKMGIDPVTHKPKNDALVSNDGQLKNAANLSHMAQWESARLEAEARLIRQSKLPSNFLFQTHLESSEFPLQASSSLNNLDNTPTPPPQVTSTTTTVRCFDVLRAWQEGAPWPKTSNEGSEEADHSPSSTLSFSENGPAGSTTAMGGDESSATMVEFMGRNPVATEQEEGLVKEEGSDEGELQVGSFIEGFTELLLRNLPESNLPETGGGAGNGSGGGQLSEDNKSYWNSILNLVNSSPSSSPLF